MTKKKKKKKGLTACLEFRSQELLGVSRELISTLSIQDVFLELLMYCVEAHAPAPQCRYVQVQDNESP